jgi:hypothetical protein
VGHYFFVFLRKVLYNHYSGNTTDVYRRLRIFCILVFIRNFVEIKMPLKKIVLDLETHPAFAKATADLSVNQKLMEVEALYA